MARVTDDGSEGQKSYHHGDLRRALCEAARSILEREGAHALSLRAVAREAGVSAAAPYHHFRNRCELLDSVADVGWEELAGALQVAVSAAGPDRKLSAIGAFYIEFARSNPAIYRLMYDRARDKIALPENQHTSEGTAYRLLHETIVETRGQATFDPLDLELACVAVWSMAHGLAEMASFKQFDRLKLQVNGEAAFISAVLSHVGLLHGADKPSLDATPKI